MKIAVFSGRFDPPHLGHFMTINNLARDHELVLVPILSYNGRLVTAAEAMETMQRVLNDMVLGPKVKLSISLTHFGKIWYVQYWDGIRRHGIDPSINDVTYYSGNEEVLKHMEEINVPAKLVPRSMDNLYSGAIIKAGINGK